MLIGLAIRDIVLVESMDLAFGDGLTALTGETGAGKSIILDALGLAVGARADAALVRRGVVQASATAIFAPGPEHGIWSYLDERGLSYDRDEDLVLRRVLGADGRSRAFVNDQAVGVGVLRDLGVMLMEVHGQHESVGLLDARTHRALLDTFGRLEGELLACQQTWSAWRAAREQHAALEAARASDAAQIESLAAHLADLDRLSPKPGEEGALAEERAVLGAAEKVIADIAAANEALGGDALNSRLSQAFRALDRAKQRTVQAGVDPLSPAPHLIEVAAAAVDRALIEAGEAAAAIDAAAGAFTFEPSRLEETETRLFALRAMARKLNVTVEDLPIVRQEFAAQLQAIENADASVAEAQARADLIWNAYLAAARALTTARQAAGDRLAAAVQAELAPLKLDKARFRVVVGSLPEDRMGPSGADKVEFEVATLAGASFASLGAIASGGELARLALALKATLAGSGGGPQPLIIFDEVDQGVGGAVADAVGQRLARLAAEAQVLVVTHSPQVAARAHAHWRVGKTGQAGSERTAVEVLGAAAREEELARMLSGEHITNAARAAARALMNA